MFLLVLLSYLFALNNRQEWTGSNIDWFMIVIMLNMAIIVGLVIVFTVIVIVRAASKDSKPRKKEVYSNTGSRIKKGSGNSENQELAVEDSPENQTTKTVSLMY